MRGKMLFVSIALLVMLFGVVFGLYIQPDAAMHPHLKPGDLLLDLYCGIGSIGLTAYGKIGRLTGVEVVPGIEVSSDYRDNNVHILGYFIGHWQGNAGFCIFLSVCHVVEDQYFLHGSSSLCGLGWRARPAGVAGLRAWVQGN